MAVNEINDDELEYLYLRIQRDSAFAHLRESDNPFVPGEGNHPRAFIIGEAPGAQEVIRRRPFVGPAGRVQRQLMSFARLQALPYGDPGDTTITPANCWLTNVLHYHPPKNRTPNNVEIQAARPYVRMEWAAVGKPRLIIPVGSAALQAITGKRVSITRMAGKYIPVKAQDGTQIHVWPMIHPSYGLRNPAIIGLIERDWETLARWLRVNDIYSS